MGRAPLYHWQTLACLLTAIGITLAAGGLPGCFNASLFTDCLLLLVPLTFGVVSLRHGWRWGVLISGLLEAGLSAFLFWWLLSASLVSLLTAGASAAVLTSTLEGLSVAALLLGASAAVSGATGAVWQGAGDTGPRLTSGTHAAGQRTLAAHRDR